MAQRTTGSRMYLSLIGVLVFAAGAVFSMLMWQSYSRARAIDEWPKVDAVVLESDIEERSVDPSRPTEYRFKILYAYEWDGGDFQSERLRLRGSSWSSARGTVEALIDRYPTGSVTEAMVNPENPEMAVLEGESRAPGYSLWFPLIFVVGGLGIIVGAWR